MSATTSAHAKPIYPIPEPELTPAELIARAAALRPMLRAQQDQNDKRGSYSEALHQEFVKAGFYRAVQPRLFGGYEFDLPAFYKAMVEISRGHPAVGWCLTLCASHPFLIASHWSEQAQIEIFGPDGHFAAPHRPQPRGTCRPVPGGYVLNGEWDYCSGIAYSTHFVGGAMLERDGAPPRLVQVTVPKAQCTVLDDWGGDATLGMQASGSNSVRVTDVVVPEHFIAVGGRGLFATPEEMVDGTPGTRLHGNPMYLGRLLGPYHASLVSPVVGAARASLDEYEVIIRSRKTISTPQMPRFEHFDFQRSFGLGLALTDAAEALLMQALETYMGYCRRWAADGTLISLEDNMRLWAMVQQAGRMASEAVEMLFHTGGSSAAKQGSRLQRYFRDVAMYRGHSSAQYPNFASALARAHFGLPVGLFGL
jgi:3-hydroxy-9,10-secoandrosta-1,3,5(10)-triene-9,17-dione monooxygenase